MRVSVAGLFDGSVEDSIERVAAAGADGIELGGWQGVDVETARDAADDHGVDIARVAADGETPGIDNVSPAVADPGSVDQSVAEIERSVEAAADLGAHTLLVTVGQRQDDCDPFAQHEALVEVFRRVAPAAEDAGVTVTPETLNRRVDHPGYYLDRSHEGYEVVDAVDSPAVKLLYDIYHQQITEGNIIQNLRNNVEHIGHIHFADVPGRHEPGTGELNYPTIFEALADAGYDGFVGAELGPLGDPDEVVADIVEMVP
jgi:hydroxypyruvate isomerase